MIYHYLIGDAPSTQPSLINLVSQIRALEIENELHEDNNSCPRRYKILCPKARSSCLHKYTHDNIIP